MAARLHGHKAYVVQHPALLVQLRFAVYPGSDDDSPGMRSIPGSRPPASEDALDALIRIESAVAWWLSQEFKRTLRGIVEANLRALVGASTEPGRTPSQLGDLAYESSRWVTWARTETGWQARPLTIPDPCPAPVCAISRKALFGDQCSKCRELATGPKLDPSRDPCPPSTCGRTHTLRVRRPDADHAWCGQCGTAWSEHHPDLPSVLLLEQALMARRAAVA
jgi:hypothetical protein